MSIEDFENLQVREYKTLYKGFELRQKYEDSRKAYWVSCLMNPHLKKPIKASDLLKPLYGNDGGGKTQAERKEEREYLEQTFGIKSERR